MYQSGNSVLHEVWCIQYTAGKNFTAAGMSNEDIERLKLEDGIRLHEATKVELETYARETSNAIVKPFLLVIARDTTHAGQLLDLIKSPEFFRGDYADKVIQVDSSQTGEKEDEMIARLLAVESTSEKTEIVIHVNMLKEGWDVTNLYTIVPLRAANAAILIEQTIGRGLRLPYDGKRTGVDKIDKLTVIAHDNFETVLAAAKDPNSVLNKMSFIEIPEENLGTKTEVVTSKPVFELKLESEQIAVNNKIITEQQYSIDSLKVELIRLDSTLISWDVEYQQNLEESNGLIQELNDNLK